jgi:hypothetical protein
MERRAHQPAAKAIRPRPTGRAGHREPIAGSPEGQGVVMEDRICHRVPDAGPQGARSRARSGGRGGRRSSGWRTSGPAARVRGLQLVRPHELGHGRILRRSPEQDLRRERDEDEARRFSTNDSARSIDARPMSQTAITLRRSSRSMRTRRRCRGGTGHDVGEHHEAHGRAGVLRDPSRDGDDRDEADPVAGARDDRRHPEREVRAGAEDAPEGRAPHQGAAG